jgi:hypothetical protein
MGKKKRSRKSSQARQTEQPPLTMPSLEPTSPSISHPSSAAISERDMFGQTLSEHPSLPELDRDMSTDDFASDYLSTADASLLIVDDAPSLEADHDDFDESQDIHEDAISMFSPSHYPTVPVAYRSETIYEDEEATMYVCVGISISDLVFGINSV